MSKGFKGFALMLAGWGVVLVAVAGLFMGWSLLAATAVGAVGYFVAVLGSDLADWKAPGAAQQSVSTSNGADDFSKDLPFLEFGASYRVNDGMYFKHQDDDL